MGSFDSNSREERFLLQHIASMFNILIDILEAIVTQPSHQKTCSYIFVHLLSNLFSPCSPSIHINQSKVTRKFSLIFSYQPPLREFFGLWTFNKKSSNFIPPKLKPKHLVSQIHVQLVLVSIALEQFTLAQEILLRLFHISVLSHNLAFFPLGHLRDYMFIIHNILIFFQVLIAKALVYFPVLNTLRVAVVGSSDGLFTMFGGIDCIFC